MSIFSFIWLIYQIYFKRGLPDLKRIQKLGLLAIKIGQVHALRIDFLDPDKCKHLSLLYRQTVPIPAEDAARLLATQLTPETRAQFSRIEPKPFASASVGQLHRATLHSGDEVVIKLIKEDFKRSFTSDVSRVRRFFKAIIAVYPKLDKVGNPLGILDHIQEYTLLELDLRNEIVGQRQLQQIAATQGAAFDLSQLAFPKTYDSLSNERTMVAEFLPGPTLDELLEKKQLPYKTLLDLFYIHGFYMFIVGTFHGDLHPGNVILNNDKLYLIDTASISHVGDKVRKNLFWFFEALSRNDYPTCAKFLNLMADKEIDGDRYSDFEKKFITLYEDFKGKTVSEVSLTRQMMYTIKLGVNSGMVFERGIFAIIKSLMYMDGMVIKCNPNAILMEDMRQFVSAYAKYIN